MKVDISSGLNGTLDVSFVSESPVCVRADMPITSAVLQPFGFLHGGATIALLESAASRGSELNADLDTERPFGIDVHVRHRKSGKAGLLHGEALLDREEDQGERGRKQFWKVVATDDEGDVVSEGVIVVKIVSLERLALKEQERAGKRQA